jgi:hypothetical protein
MIRIRSPRSAKTTNSIRAICDMPMITKRFGPKHVEAQTLLLLQGQTTRPKRLVVSCELLMPKVVQDAARRMPVAPCEKGSRRSIFERLRPDGGVHSSVARFRGRYRRFR